MTKWLALAASPAQFAVAQTMLWSINGSLEILLGPLIGSLSDTYGRKWIMCFGRVGIGLIHVGYGFSTQLWWDLRAPMHSSLCTALVGSSACGVQHCGQAAALTAGRARTGVFACASGTWWRLKSSGSG